MALMTSSIQRHKFSKHVKAKHLEHLSKVRNATLALKEEAKAIIGNLKRKLKRSEDSYNSMVAQVIERERRIENLSAILQDSQRDVDLAREELGVKSNERIRAENDLKKDVEDATRQAMVDTLDRVCLQVEVKREVERYEMREEAIRVAEAQYLASDAFSIIEADCF